LAIGERRKHCGKFAGTEIFDFAIIIADKETLVYGSFLVY
jgi:hypothetical protein